MSKKWRVILICLAISIGTLLLVLFLGSQRHFYRRSIREIETNVRSLGIFSPIAVIVLVILSTVIPPLPLPIPFIEITAGIIFGFIQGFLLNWIAQVVSSVAAYYVAQRFGKRIMKFFGKQKFLSYYTDYLKKSGAKAILATRATLASPFNIVSFLAGLIEIEFSKFFLATVIGTIPDAALYAFIGSIIRKTRLSLGWVF